MDKAKIDAVVAEVKAALGDLKGARGFFAICKAIPDVVKHIEDAGLKLGIAGADKRELALDVLFSLIPLPIYIKPFAGLLRMLAGQLIDMAVAAVNKQIKK